MTALPTREQIEIDVLKDIVKGEITLPAQECNIKTLIAKGITQDARGFEGLLAQVALAADCDRVLIGYYAIGLVHGMEKEHELSALFDDYGRPDDILDKFTCKDSDWYKAHKEIGTIMDDKSRVDAVRCLEGEAGKFVERKYGIAKPGL
ncbi:MAG: hypothetical protein AB7H77_08475 [Bdellovibrionales bacterium]